MLLQILLPSLAVLARAADPSPTPSPSPAPVAEAAPAPSPAPAPARNPLAFEIDKIDGGVVTFKAGPSGDKPATLKTALHDLAFVGKLPPAEGSEQPFLLFSGKTCQNCSNDRALFMIRIDGGKAAQFVHPGKIFDPKSRALLMESRGFYGQCLAGGKAGYVVFQKERIDRRRHLQTSVYVAEPGKDFVQERLIERRLPRIEQTLRFVKRKTCHEIAGINRLMMRKKIDLTPKRDKEDDDDDSDDAPPKENQTDGELGT